MKDCDEGWYQIEDELNKCFKDVECNSEHGDKCSKCMIGYDVNDDFKNTWN